VGLSRLIVVILRAENVPAMLADQNGLAIWAKNFHVRLENGDMRVSRPGLKWLLAPLANQGLFAE
jgi:hypothetical protein